MQQINGALILFAKDLSFLFLLAAPVTEIVPLTTTYPSLLSHKSDCRIDVLNLISLLILYGLLTDHELLSIF